MTKFGKRALNKAQTRLDILGELYRLSEKVNFRELKVKTIAESANITEMTFFNYFQRKEDALKYMMGIWALDLMALQHKEPLTGEAAIRRYIARPAISEKRLSLTQQGKVRYKLKTPYRNGTTHVTALAHPVLRGISTSMYKIFEPLDFLYRMYGMPRAQEYAGAVIAKLAALVPKPRVNLIHYHSVFAPNSKHRARVTPAKRGKGIEPKAKEARSCSERRKGLTGFCSCKTGIHAMRNDMGDVYGRLPHQRMNCRGQVNKH